MGATVVFSSQCEFNLTISIQRNVKIGNKYSWKIGPLQNIGAPSGTLKSKDVTVQCPFDLESKGWYVDNGWSNGISDEINVHCLKGNFLEILEVLTYPKNTAWDVHSVSICIICSDFGVL